VEPAICSGGSVCLLGDGPVNPRREVPTTSLRYEVQQWVENTPEPPEADCVSDG
jgi:hypothetical protein